jgi:2',3'-cyclic-nucleotide 2'-phosphodiesterase (5'-nucleotidase family)
MLNSNDDESEMGNFVADGMRQHCDADVVLLNRGMMRVNWQQGVFSVYDLYETFPFEDEIVSFDVTGEELIRMVRTLQEGYLGFYITSGLQQHVCASPHSLINVTLEHGVEIKMEKIYKVATIKFMIMGGDDFANVLEYYVPRNWVYHDNVREVIRDKIIETKVLNVNGNRYIDPANRRLIVHDCKKLEFPTKYTEFME